MGRGIKIRANKIKLMFAVLLLLLALRLAYIQIYCGDELAAGAAGQQAIPVLKNNARGVIYDRNMVPLTNSADGYYYMLPAASASKPPAKLLSYIDAVPAGRKGEDYQVYKSQKWNSAVTEKLKAEYGAYIFSSGSRYADAQTAVHLIGSLDEGGTQGLTGLEKMFQYRLSNAAVKTSMTGDGAGTPIKGFGLSVERESSEFGPSSLVTTIDSALQSCVEEILHSEGITGAVVVMGAQNGEILAMASGPTYNPNRIAEYLAEENSALMNRAVSGLYPPGSIFKIVTAAAALEKGKVTASHQYTCTGAITVNGVKLICESKPKGHGALDMKTAFAVSCNCYFAHVADLIGGSAIAETAEKMGIGTRVFRNFPGEEEGGLPPESEYSLQGLSNFSIGQGSLLITPLQAAKMTSIIASGGVVRTPTLLMTSGTLGAQEKRALSPETAAEVQDMMEEVMASGTGFDGEAAANAKVKAAGKTGSAEGAFLGGEAVHGWFTGYFPAEEPEYVVTVVCENGKTGSGSALPVFYRILDFLY